MWGTTAAGTFIINFYDSSKLSSTNGTDLTNSNYSSFVDVPSGATATDVVTSVSVTGTVQYGKNGGLTAGTRTAASADTHYVTFNIGNDYKVTKCTVYATAYESGRWLLNGNAASSGSLGSMGATIDKVTSPLVWNNLGGLSSLTFKKDNGSGGNQKRLTIYKIVCEYQVTVVATDLDVKTAPTKVNYKVGETLDLTGLVLDATVGGNHVDVTSGYTASPANGATLNSVGAQTITFTYGGQTTTQTIHVGDLESIALTTTGVKTTYDEGQTFDPENLVVTATYSDGEDTPTTWTEDVTASCSYDPDGALKTTDDNVEVSYTWGSTTKTDNITITVNAATAYTVTFNAGTGSCATSSLPEAAGLAGVELPTATIGITGWSFAGWATASTTNTEVAPTLYTAGSTYHPTDNCTLYAVYKFTEGTEGEYKRATKLTEVKAASQVILVNGGKTLTTDLSAKDALSESEGVVTAEDKTVFTLSGNDTDGYVLSSASGNIGASSLPTSNGNYQDLAVTSTNSTWTITTNSTANTFTFLNKGGTNVGLEYYSTVSKWVAYKTSSPTTSSYYSTKVYIPNWTTVYNSNPAAIVNPTIAWTTSGDKTLYLKNTNTYDNAANVTGISKTPVYTSSDATVATVSDAGLVTALKAGTTTITATVAAEVGVNTKASASYEVTVKDASNIAGLKEVATNTTPKSFTVDLTDAVVTYVKDNHAYIQDASGAVYASCGSSLTAGKKINGAVSGSIKVANQIDEITAIDLSDEEITDGVIPSAAVITAATLAANKADYEGKLVSIEDATVTSSLANGSASGGKISDDSKVTEINLYAPDSNIEALKDAEGTFNGYISLFNGGLRFNIYEQSQITLTKNAPTAQPLTFASDAVELDEETDAYSAFTGQAVSGAIGDVTYSIEDGDDKSGVVSSINASTGAVVLSGACGTATITATAAAKEVTVDGVTTPYTETAKSYTVTVRPRYMVTFSVNGVETVLRQATFGASIDVPTPSDFGDYKFMGWSESTVDPTDSKPSMQDLGSSLTPTDNSKKYYAVFAKATGTPVVEHESTFTIKQASAPYSPYVNDGSSWTWSDVTFKDADGACINNTNGSVSFTLPSGGKAVSLTITKTGNTWAGAAVVVLKDASSNTLKSFSLGSSTSDTYDFTSSYDHAASYTLTNTTSKDAWVKDIVFSYTTGGVSYSDYRTSFDEVEVTIPSSKLLSFCYGQKLDFSETAVKAYKASVDEGEGKVTLAKVDVVPAGEGVILYCATPNTYSIPVTTKEASDVTGNAMKRVLERTQVLWNPETDVYNYILQQGQFNKANGGYLKANRAYLQTSYNVDAEARALEIVFDEGETTAISEVRGLKTEVRGEFFNLNGQRVATPVKGNIYIVNGKKVMFK